MRKKALVLGVLFALVYAGAVGTVATRGGTTEALAEGVETLIYFVRHGEDEVALIDPERGRRLGLKVLLTDCKTFGRGKERDECCLEILNPLGEMRAILLANWFLDQGITEQLTHVIASHKIRTRQTVGEIAADAALGGDIDQNPGDGVQQIPPFVEECDDGFESSKSSRDPMIAALGALLPGSTAVVGAHSPTIYPIMESFGIDTSDPVDFPRRPNGKVKGFNNLWIVSIDGNGVGQLVEHVVLALELVEQTAE